LDGTGKLDLRGIIARPDGVEKAEVELSGLASEAELLGTQVAEKLLIEAGPSILDAIKASGPDIIHPHPEMEHPENMKENQQED
jgi:hypothetical protein